MDHSIVHCVTWSLAASIGMTVIAILVALIQLFRSRNSISRDRVSTLLVVSFFLLLSIVFLRYGEFRYASSEGKQHALGIETTIDAWIAGILAALRTVGMEESYGEILDNLRSMIASTVPNCKLLGSIALFNAAGLHLLAPIAGGAIILEILASIFPKLRFWRVRHLCFKEKAYFSELNAESLAMAKSLQETYAKTPWKRKPVLIFTDVYIDDETEKDYELFLEAKRIGAICVRDDLSHVPKRGLGKRSYFLMDQNEFGNLQTLTALSEDRNIPYVQGVKLYLFVQSDAYIRLEKQINKRLTVYWKGKKTYCWKQKRIEARLTRIDKLIESHKAASEDLAARKEEFEAKKDKLNRKCKALERSIADKLPVIIPVFGYRNLVLNLFSDVPLYEPLIYRETKDTLKITILGSGIIGTEAFLNAYWLGQMMHSHEDHTIEPCKLHIDILSKEKGKDFLSKLDYISPEIRSSIRMTVHSDGDTVTCPTPESTLNPYATVCYRETDIKIGSFWDQGDADSQSILDSDYIIVALGTDLDNMSVAEKLRIFIGQRHLTSPASKDTVIAYTVFHPELCRTLNGSPKVTSFPKDIGASRIYMHAFGSLEQVYSTDNIFLSESKALADEMGDAYSKQHSSKAYLAEHATRSENDNKNFNFWANIARVRHTKYKLFSLGWVDFSLLDEGQEDIAIHGQKMQKLCAQYRRIATLPPASLADLDKGKSMDLEEKKHSLAWLEHRRWVAFTRTMGFRSTEALTENLRTTETHKNMPLKLHPCLVEAELREEKGQKVFIHGTFDKKGKLAKATVFSKNSDKDPLGSGSYDALDLLSRRWQRIYREEVDPEAEIDDFKKYDYYRYEYADCIRSSAFLRWNQEKNGSQKQGKRKIPWLIAPVLELLCRLGKKHGIYAYNTSDPEEKEQHKQKKQGSSTGKNAPDWIIPVAYLQKLISLTHRAVDKGSSADQKERIPGAFDFEGTLYVPKYRKKQQVPVSK